MNIQSISVVVPTKGCVNKCKFCVSCMHDNPYENKFDEIAYRKRIKRASIDRVNTCILTGTGEALQNPRFLKKLKDVFDKEHHPFPNVEIQTSGVMLMENDGIEQIKYFLENDDERKKIAKAGFERTIKDHKMEYRLDKMIEDSVNGNVWKWRK